MLTNKIPREEMSSIITSMVSTMPAATYHTQLIKAYSRGQKGVGKVSYAALKAEQFVQSKSNVAVAAAIEEYVTAVALAEATAIGLCDDSSSDEELELSVRVADYLLTRMCPVSRILSTNGALILDQVLNNRTPWVDPEVLFNTYLVCMDGHTPVLPGSKAQADYLVAADYRVLQPQLAHAIAKHAAEGSDRTWWSLESAHGRAVADAAATYDTRLSIFTAVETTITSFVEAARLVPGLELGAEEDTWVVARGFAPRAARLSDVLAAAKWEVL